MDIAILIDAENVEPVYADQIFSYASSIGTVKVKEIYGAGIALNEWASPILQYAIHMNMTLRPNRYKNSSDIALVIGAMDLLAERTAASLTAAGPLPEGQRSGQFLREPRADRVIDAIIIASSDSDFSSLAIRLRTAGIEVVGMGNPEKINPTWPIACSSFVPLTPVESGGPSGGQQRNQSHRGEQSQKKAEQPQKQEPAQKKSEPPQKQDAGQKKNEQPQKQEPAQKKAEQPQKQEPAQKKAEQPQKQEPAQKKNDAPQKAEAAPKPEAVPKKAEQQKGKKKDQKAAQGQKEGAPAVAPTHSARAEIIRSFINAQISASGGRIQSSTLLNQLNDLPDYRFDQQRSQRRPLDYLIRQYSGSFRFEKEADGIYWITPQAGQPQKAAAASPARVKIDGAALELKVVKPETSENKEAEVKLIAPHLELFASKVSDTFEQSIDECATALERQLIKAKEKKQ